MRDFHTTDSVILEQTSSFLYFFRSEGDDDDVADLFSLIFLKKIIQVVTLS